MVKINLEGNTVSGCFFLSKEESLALNIKIIDTVNAWKKNPNEDVNTGDLLKDMLSLATTGYEQLYTAYQYGRMVELGFAKLLMFDLDTTISL